MATSDQWLTDYDIIDENGNELMHKISQRNQFPKNSIAFSRTDIQVQQMMKNFSQRLSQLQQQLIQNSKSNQLTTAEMERRQRLVDNLNYRYKQMEISLANPDADRSALLGNQSQSIYGTNGNQDIERGETTADRNLTSQQYQQQRQLLMREQDKGLESLSEIIERQKHLAQGISSEIDIQNEIIDDIGDAMDQTNDRLLRNTRNIRKVGLKSGTCCYWVIITLLFVAIITVSFI
ncbi:syntaxin-8-like isoform X2 [Oppia nitens]|uniref:syntaxin-8-like isoform X2 n=1 Tax=Oppia nitens TaxID=1686743 RepID=UPI0023DC3DF2|nr:syntaxin-8-like isoform X2 [Oppia nitens]